MENKKRNINIYAFVLAAMGSAALIWAVYGFPTEQLEISSSGGVGLLALAAVTILFGSRLKIRLPRAEIRLTIADALIILSLLVYGAAAAVLLAAAESLFAAAAAFRRGERTGGEIKIGGLRAAAAALAYFAAAFIVGLIFDSPEKITVSGNAVEFIALAGTLTLTLFFFKSLATALADAAIEREKSLLRAWSERSVETLATFLIAAAFACLAAKFVNAANMLALSAPLGFAALIYDIYRRRVEAFKKTAAKAEQTERARAEQAESHIVELRRHIAEQERVCQALRESKEHFRRAAFHDGLTNLPNRNSFIETLKFCLEKSRHSSGQNFAVLFLDLDRFKTVNESLGHSTGDTLLRHVSERLKKLIGDEDTLARFGGDEFGVILRRVRAADEAISFAQLINHKLASPFDIGGRQVFVTASIGIALGNSACAEAEDVLRDADIAMYYAKERQKSYEIFDQTMHARAVALLQIETDLRYAVERGELCAFYQPIVSLDTMRLSGFETLIRWKHPQRGLVSPSDFIPISEETGLIVPITLWILRESCRRAVEWRRRDPLAAPLTISVNLSGKHFAQGNLVEEVAKIIGETGIEPACLKLEITESAVMENAEKAIAMLKELKKLGVQLSIDDFGTGYSSLSYLHRFPIDTLKVDRSFVSTMEDGSENGEIVRTIIALAKTLSMDVVAEGIESIHQLHQLRILGCEYGQGYLFSQPVPTDEAEKMALDRGRWQTIMQTTQVAAAETADSAPKLILPPPTAAPERQQSRLTK